MTNLAGFRTRINDQLATAVDSSTWTTAIQDEALRLALAELDNMLVYEDSFTVSVTGYEQTITITDLKHILALAYPWYEGYEWARAIAPWRMKAPPNEVVFTHWQPAAGEVIRARYNKSHTIENLDSAIATTVPAQHETLLALLACAHACMMRVRQLSENPAVPKEAAAKLIDAADHYRLQAAQLWSHSPTNQPLSWNQYGL